jgi:hypothetical protein
MYREARYAASFNLGSQCLTSFANANMAPTSAIMFTTSAPRIMQKIPVHNVGLDRFELQLEAQPGSPNIAAKISGFRPEITYRGPCCSASSKNQLGLRLGEAGLAQSFRNFQCIDRHPASVHVRDRKA